ncbi:MAG: acyl-CoA dehydrogenase family protein, partial [Spongiibacter sp.]|nr:acyl-CoA dehydrogenase family protein [Spongiibacter sp.]
VVMSGLDLERAMINPLCVGIAERALELCVDYAKTREQFKQPIASFQMVQSRLADMYAWIESMKLMTYRALAACQKVGHGEAGRGEIHKITAAAIMYVANTMNQVVDNGVQIHGGSGYIWESEMNRLFRATKLMEIGAGTTEVRKLIIAGELLSE